MRLIKTYCIFYLLFLSSCDKLSRGVLEFENLTSSIPLYIVDNIDFTENNNQSLYPDTNIVEISNTYARTPLLPNEITLFYDYSTPLKLFYNSVAFNDTISFFVFNADTVNFYGWETIRDEYKVLARYDLSYNNVKSLKYRIPYPPTSRMHNMKMYIP